MSGVSDLLLASPDELAALLERAPDYRVLRRFEPQRVYAPVADENNVRTALFVDIEATGLDTETDEIIELALVPFRFHLGGVVVDVREPIAFFEQPTKPITAEITELTGITPEMVAGQGIDDTTVAMLFDEAVLLIAHSARFDRPMFERRFPTLRKKHWACTQEGIDWKAFGVAGGALANIAMTACGVFTEGMHRAAHDCQLGVHVLATARLEGTSAMELLLQSARSSLRRIRALGSPRWTKNWLKSHGYHAKYIGDEFCYWFKDMRASASSDEVRAETDLCADEAECEPDVQLISSMDRYSIRA